MAGQNRHELRYAMFIMCCLEVTLILKASLNDQEYVFGRI